MELRWRGGDLDRIVDRAHAAIVARSIHVLKRCGLEPVPEVTYSIYGERGSIDLLAVDRANSRCVVVEVKSMLASIEETLRCHDTKVRLAPDIVQDRFGWRPGRVQRLLVLPNTSTARRAVAMHRIVLERPYPVVGRAVKVWLRGEASADPGIAARAGGANGASAGGILFVSVTPATSVRRTRVRCSAATRGTDRDPTLAPGRADARTAPRGTEP